MSDPLAPTFAPARPPMLDDIVVDVFEGLVTLAGLAAVAFAAWIILAP